jgi:hypothetical protein
LGQERNCPKCGLTIVLDLESNRSTYDLLGGSSGKATSQTAETPGVPAGPMWSEDDIAHDDSDLPDEHVPVLRRGAHREAAGTASRKQNSGTRGGGISLTNKPMIIVAGLIVCVLLGLLVHFVASYVGSNPPNPTETVLITSPTGAIDIA